MRMSAFAEEQTTFVPRQAASSTAIDEVSRNLHITETMIGLWKKDCGSLRTAEVRELRQLREVGNDLTSWFPTRSRTATL